MNNAVPAAQDMVGESERDHQLYLIVGNYLVSPRNHEVFQRFKRWVAEVLAQSTIETYQATGVTLRRRDEKGREMFPHLLGNCDCGTYLPLADIDPRPMLASEPQLVKKLEQVAVHRVAMVPEHRRLLDALIQIGAGALKPQVQPFQKGKYCMKKSDHHFGIEVAGVDSDASGARIQAAGDWLLVTDAANSRLIGWHIDDCATGVAAHALTAQLDFHAKSDNHWQMPVRDSLCWPYGIRACGNSIVVSDSDNSRVLLWKLAQECRP